jgi:hypothetical protein
LPEIEAAQEKLTKLQPGIAPPEPSLGEEVWEDATKRELISKGLIGGGLAAATGAGKAIAGLDTELTRGGVPQVSEFLAEQGVDLPKGFVPKKPGRLTGYALERGLPESSDLIHENLSEWLTNTRKADPKRLGKLMAGEKTLEDLLLSSGTKVPSIEGVTTPYLQARNTVYDLTDELADYAKGSKDYLSTATKLRQAERARDLALDTLKTSLPDLRKLQDIGMRGRRSAISRFMPKKFYIPAAMAAPWLAAYGPEAAMSYIPYWIRKAMGGTRPSALSPEKAQQAQEFIRQMGGAAQ